MAIRSIHSRVGTEEDSEDLQSLERIINSPEMRRAVEVRWEGEGRGEGRKEGDGREGGGERGGEEGGEGEGRGREEGTLGEGQVGSGKVGRVRERG